MTKDPNDTVSRRGALDFISKTRQLLSEALIAMSEVRENHQKIGETFATIISPDRFNKFTFRDILEIQARDVSIAMQVLSRTIKVQPVLQDAYELSVQASVQGHKSSPKALQNEPCLSLESEFDVKFSSLAKNTWASFASAYISLEAINRAQAMLLDPDCAPKSTFLDWSKTIAKDAVGIVIPGLGTAEKVYNELIQRTARYKKVMKASAENYSRVRAYDEELRKIEEQLSSTESELMSHMDKCAEYLKECISIRDKLLEYKCWKAS